MKSQELSITQINLKPWNILGFIKQLQNTFLILFFFNPHVYIFIKYSL